MFCQVHDLGLIDYGIGWQLQKDFFSEVETSKNSHTLILCRHNPVITLGRNAHEENILFSRDDLFLKGVDLFQTERGGDVTYHGPGQIVAYPIFNLAYLKKDIHWFLRKLEDVAIDFLSELGVNCNRRPGLTGVWVDKKKIASIGISIRHWITFHGMSINIKDADLADFSLIRPCGMDIEMTSLETVLAKEMQVDDLKEVLADKFCAGFRLKALMQEEAGIWRK